MSDNDSNNLGPPLRPHNPVIPGNRFEVIAACRSSRRPSDPPNVDYYYVAWAPAREPNRTLEEDSPELTNLAFDCVETAHDGLSGEEQTHAITRSGLLGATTKNYITRLYQAAAVHIRSLVTCDIRLDRGGPLRSLELDFPEFVTTRTTPENLEWLNPPPEPAEDPPVAAP